MSVSRVTGLAEADAGSGAAPGALPAPAPASAAWQRGRWLLGWAGRVAEFGFVQCWVQLLLGVAGILIIRTMSKQEYALFAITNQMQTACNLLADLGIGIGVRSIGGRVWQDRERFGSLVATALDLRRWFAFGSLACCLPVAGWMLRSNGAGWTGVAVLCGVLVASVLPLLASSVHLVVPQLHGEYRRIQKLDLANAGLRLALIAGLATSRMTAALAAGVGAIANWVQLAWLRRWSRDHASPSATSNSDDRRELVRLSVQTLPNTLFFCFQGQVTLLILTLVGNPTGIADITALGRLAVLLTAFSAAFTNVLVPRFARCQDARRLPRLYVGLTGAAAAALVPVVLAGWLFPGPLLGVLGEKYEGLEWACGVVVMTGCVSLLAAVLWQLNVSKAWITVQSKLFVIVIVLTQLVAATLLDLRQFDNVVLFGLATSVAPVPLYIWDAVLGLRKRQ